MASPLLAERFIDFSFPPLTEVKCTLCGGTGFCVMLGPKLLIPLICPIGAQWLGELRHVCCDPRLFLGPGTNRQVL